MYIFNITAEVRIYVNGICALRKSNFFTPPTPPPIFPMLADKLVLPVSACFSMKKKISIRVESCLKKADTQKIEMFNKFSSWCMNIAAHFEIKTHDFDTLKFK